MGQKVSRSINGMSLCKNFLFFRHLYALGSRAWDVRVRPEQQSYVDAAIRKGYSILTFDRIGTGKSSLVNAYDEAQPNTEIEILAKITTLARSGKLLSAANIVSNDNTTVPTLNPTQIVHVGHSFGSLLILGLLQKSGDLSDGALLTGFLNSKELGAVPVGTFEHAYAATHDPARFGRFGSGYVVLTTLNTLQKLYFTEKTLDTELLDYTEKVKQAEPVAVYASAGQVFGAENTGLFKGPVQVCSRVLPIEY
jgi:pimeloyl-ACP methyl ester carboxylesterase